MPQKKLKVGLALGGGGARGCAHIGVIRALEEEGVRIHCIAGTSIGSFVGGIYAAGDIHALEDFLLKVKWKDVVRHLDPVLPKKGLFEGEKIRDLINRLLPEHDFGSTKIPYMAIATDLLSGEEVRITSGNMVDAIRASIAIPAVFTPFKKDDRYLIDGGVVNPLPVNAVREMGADIVIAVDLNHQFINEKLNSRRSYEAHEKNKWSGWLTPAYPNILDVVENSIFLMQDQITKKNLDTDAPDFIIRPNLESAGMFDFHKAKNLIEEGYRAMKVEMSKLKKLLK